MGRKRRDGRQRGRGERGERRDWANAPPRSVPLAAEGGIKAESRQGAFGSSWWARRWQAVLESFRIGGRLARGRNYARDGQVLSVEIVRGKVRSRVQGSRPTPYDVTIGVKVLTDEEWDNVIGALSRQALFVAKLLAGEMPEDIEKAFTQEGLSLFPEKRGDLKTDCSCPDDANPCKHIAAVYYLLGEEFDRDPFLIFQLRGLERSKLAEKLSGRAAEQEGPKAELREPLSAAPGDFWGLGPVPDDLFGEVQAPPVSAGLVQRLGKFPFWRGENPLLASVEAAYVDASAAGVKAFLGEKPEPKGK